MGLEHGYREARAEGAPKKFNPESFKKFLGRQVQHMKMRQQRGNNGQVSDHFVKAPLLPITSLVYIVQGSAFMDRRTKVQDIPKTNKRPRSSGFTRPETPEWKKFLSRQNATIERARNRSTSAPPTRPAIVIDADGEAEFLERQKGILEERKKNVKALEEMMIKETMLANDFARRQHDRSRKQTPGWLEKNGPKGSQHIRDKAIAEAQANWKKDYKFEVGESPILKNKVVSTKEAEEFFQKMKEFPNVANRVPIAKPPPYEQTGFRVSGNPYEGGKADKLRQKLGDKAGVGRLPAS